MKRDERTILVKDYHVVIASDQTWFTVYQDDLPVAPIRRPERGRTAWALWYARGDNQAVMYGIGPRTLLAKFANR